MDVLGQFKGLLNPQKRQVAQITGGKGAGVWVAETPSGAVVVLEGEAQIGQSVYYDAYSREIAGQAPEVVWVEIGV